MTLISCGMECREFSDLGVFHLLALLRPLRDARFHQLFIYSHQVISSFQLNNWVCIDCTQLRGCKGHDSVSPLANSQLSAS